MAARNVVVWMLSCCSRAVPARWHGAMGLGSHIGEVALELGLTVLKLCGLVSTWEQGCTHDERHHRRCLAHCGDLQVMLLQCMQAMQKKFFSLL